MSPTLARTRHLLARAIEHQIECNKYADQLPYEIAQTLRSAAQARVDEALAREVEVEEACARLASVPRLRMVKGGAR